MIWLLSISTKEWNACERWFNFSESYWFIYKKIVVFFLDDELQCDEQCQTKEQYLAYINATRI